MKYSRSLFLCLLAATHLAVADPPSPTALSEASVRCEGEVAQQQTKSSRWRSSSGAVIDITSSETWITVKVTPKQGQPAVWKGRWLRKYDLFEYTASGGTNTAQMVGNTINVTTPQGQKFTWNLMGVTSQGSATNNSNYPYASNITGRWSSSSGNVFDVKPQGSQVSVTGFLTDGRQLKTTGRWLNTVSFSYQFPGYNVATKATLLKDGRLKVETPGRQPTFWKKI